MGMRSIANLSISLGLFGFPVKVYKAVNDPTDGVQFRQVHETCKTPINQIKRCSRCNVDVSQAELLKGFETPGGMVTFTEDEIKALKPEAASIIKIDGYLDADAIDSTYHDGSVYYLKPDGKDFATFVTFREALAGRWAVGKVVMYGREHVVAIQAVERVLSMHFIRTQAEIRSVDGIPGYDGIPETAKAEHLTLMSQLMDAAPLAFENVALETDSYVTAVQELVASRVAGQPAPAQPDSKPAPTGGDLLTLLKASLAATKAA